MIQYNCTLCLGCHIYQCCLACDCGISVKPPNHILIESNVATIECVLSCQRSKAQRHMVWLSFSSCAVEKYQHDFARLTAKI